MSISFCNECRRVVEGHTEYHFDMDEEIEREICGYCGGYTVQLKEDKDE